MALSTIKTNSIDDSAITADKIADTTITNGKIANTTITGATHRLRCEDTKRSPIDSTQVI